MPARLLVLGCSATKRRDPGALPAIERYDGPMWRTLRAALSEIRPAERPRVAVLSAEHGFIPALKPIADYDRRMDRARAAELAADPLQVDRLGVLAFDASEIHVAGGAVYRSCVLQALGVLGRVSGEVTHPAPGLGIGRQRQALRAWLAQMEA